MFKIPTVSFKRFKILNGSFSTFEHFFSKIGDILSKSKCLPSKTNSLYLAIIKTGVNSQKRLKFDGYAHPARPSPTPTQKELTVVSKKRRNWIVPVELLTKEYISWVYSFP